MVKDKRQKFEETFFIAGPTKNVHPTIGHFSPLLIQQKMLTTTHLGKFFHFYRFNEKNCRSTVPFHKLHRWTTWSSPSSVHETGDGFEHRTSDRNAKLFFAEVFILQSQLPNCKPTIAHSPTPNNSIIPAATHQGMHSVSNLTVQIADKLKASARRCFGPIFPHWPHHDNSCLLLDNRKMVRFNGDLKTNSL